jgi:DDE superfamily endonuclease/helix-turn-helix, Psq domain
LKFGDFRFKFPGKMGRRSKKVEADYAKDEAYNRRLSKAITAVSKGDLSLRKAAVKYDVKHTTIKWRLDKVKNGEIYIPYESRRVFSAAAEEALSDYFIFAAKIHHGITYQKARTLAYEYALSLKLTNIPTNWHTNQIAGEDWLKGFMKRQAQLSLRKPENTARARNAAFNKNNVNRFYDNLATVYAEHDYQANEIFNLDETGLYTVVDPPKVIAERGARQVGQFSTHERGELVTFVGIVCAAGTPVPPVYIFPRVNYKDSFLNGAPAQSLGLSSRNGWMTTDLFVEVLQHMKSYTRCSKESPILLILDNHVSHTSIAGIKYCRDNGIELLSLPPHCSHKLQPLDKCVFGPFKAQMRVAMNDFMSSAKNAGKWYC